MQWTNLWLLFHSREKEAGAQVQGQPQQPRKTLPLACKSRAWDRAQSLKCLLHTHTGTWVWIPGTQIKKKKKARCGRAYYNPSAGEAGSPRLVDQLSGRHLMSAWLPHRCAHPCAHTYSRDEGARQALLSIQNQQFCLSQFSFGFSLSEHHREETGQWVEIL